MLSLQFMTIDPKNITNHKEFHDILLGTVAPRPIALASTIDRMGNVNLSPFSFFNVFSSRPPILVFSPSRRQRDNTTKHTLENILETKEVVVNTVSHAMVEQISLASAEYPKGINEFIKSGLTEIKSERVKPPRAKESPASFECRVLEVKVLGDEGGAGNLVICEVLLMHVQDCILNEKGKVDPYKVDSVARMGEDYYCRVQGESIFELPRPVATGGIGFDVLPAEIKNSTVLTGNNLGRLANVHQLPSAEDVRAFAENFDYDLIARGNEKGWIPAIHQYAQRLINEGDVKKAWLLLLSTTHKLRHGTE